MTPIQKVDGIGDRIRARRLLLGLSQEALAQTLRLSPQQIHKYEKGQSDIPSSRLEELSKALQAPIGYFFGQYGDDFRLPSDLVEMLAKPRAVRAVQLFEKLNLTQKRAVIELMRALITEPKDDIAEEPTPIRLTAKNGTTGRA